MNASMLLAGHAGFFSLALYYVLLTAHTCLFVDLSRFQKRPMSRLNFNLASLASALPSAGLTRFLPHSLGLNVHWVGIAVALLLSVVLALTIQQIVKIDVEY